MKKKFISTFISGAVFLSMFAGISSADEYPSNWSEKKKADMAALQKDFAWWPTDAKPAPVRDEKGGYWWWPTQPGKTRPWGNRGYVYVYRIITDYKEEELPPPQPQEMRASLLVKKIIKNVRILFDYDKDEIRPDAAEILENAVDTLRRNPEASILVTGSCDQRGSEKYNEKLGRQRAESVKDFMMEKGVAEDKIKIISRGKLDAAAPLNDLVGMQKDRNAHFVIAEVEEIMLPYQGEAKIPDAKEVEEGKFVVEEEKNIESAVQVKTEEYITQKGDTLWKIAEKKLGSGYRWKYLYELNKDVIKNPDRLRPGKKILIPIE